jgi:uncharacterized RDD family membrane protein YckC
MAVTYSLLPLFVNDFLNRFWGAIYSAGKAAAEAGGQVGALSDDLSHVTTIATYSMLGATVAYGLLGLMLWSRTPGQRALGIAVSPVDRGKDRIQGPAAVSRTLLWTLLSQGGNLFWLLQLISLGLMVWHPKRQSLPDLLARTQVVRRR